MRVAIGLLALLSGCSGENTVRNDLQPAIQQNASASEAKGLVGRWSLDGTCDADDVTINADGTWKGSVQAGRWQAKDKQLVLTRVARLGDEGGQPERRVGTITSLTETQLALSYDGQPEVWFRCN